MSVIKAIGRCAAAGCLVGAVSCGGTVIDPGGGPPPAGFPGITCPASLTVNASSFTSTSAQVTYGNPAVSGGTPPVTTSCTVGTNGLGTFPAGTTAVTCTVTDAISRQAVCSFNVTVVIPPPPIPILKGTRFIAFGDSITRGEDGVSVRGVMVVNRATSYPVLLENALIARYTAQSPRVLIDGTSGETALQGTGHIGSDILSNKPDALFLLEGVNDFCCLPVYSVDGPPMIARVKEYLRFDIRVGLANGLKVFISTLLPEVKGPPGGTLSRAYMLNGDMDLLTPMNEAIRSLAVEEGVVLVDGFLALTNNVGANIGADGLHPTPAGNQKLADAFLAAIIAHYESAQTLATRGRGGR